MFAFQLVADALGVPLAEGKAHWDQAQARLKRQQQQLPPTTRTKPPGARQPTPTLAADFAAVVDLPDGLSATPPPPLPESVAAGYEQVIDMRDFAFDPAFRGVAMIDYFLRALGLAPRPCRPRCAATPGSPRAWRRRHCQGCRAATR